MTREEAIAALRVQQANSDNEEAHIRADEILCQLLSALGCEDVVDEWEKIRKWYA